MGTCFYFSSTYAWIPTNCCWRTPKSRCRNPSFGLATKVKGVARLRAKRKEARESRQRHCKSAGQEEAQELKREEARESHHILPGVLESVREYEGVNPHTPKATPTWGMGSRWTLETSESNCRGQTQWLVTFFISLKSS
jgi:hypothetical protein